MKEAINPDRKEKRKCSFCNYEWNNSRKYNKAKCPKCLKEQL